VRPSLVAAGERHAVCCTTAADEAPKAALCHTSVRCGRHFGGQWLHLDHRCVCLRAFWCARAVSRGNRVCMCACVCMCVQRAEAMEDETSDIVEASTAEALEARRRIAAERVRGA
jgi:hypothetical protein